MHFECFRITGIFSPIWWCVWLITFGTFPKHFTFSDFSTILLCNEKEWINSLKPYYWLKMKTKSENFCLAHDLTFLRQSTREPANTTEIPTSYKYFNFHRIAQFRTVSWLVEQFVKGRHFRCAGVPADCRTKKINHSIFENSDQNWILVGRVDILA